MLRLVILYPSHVGDDEHEATATTDVHEDYCLVKSSTSSCLDIASYEDMMPLLPPCLCRALRTNLGYKAQPPLGHRLCIPPLLVGNRDVLIRSRNRGCGTSTALLIALMGRINFFDVRPLVQGIMLFSTREVVYNFFGLAQSLLRDVQDAVTAQWCERKNRRRSRTQGESCCDDGNKQREQQEEEDGKRSSNVSDKDDVECCQMLVGGLRMRDQIIKLRSGRVRLVLGTPGRMLDMMHRRVLDSSGVHSFYIDDLSEMIDMGFRDQLYDLFTVLPPSVFVAATTMFESHEVEAFVKRVFRS